MTEKNTIDYNNNGFNDNYNSNDGNLVIMMTKNIHTNILVLSQDIPILGTFLGEEGPKNSGKGKLPPFSGNARKKTRF